MTSEVLLKLIDTVIASRAEYQNIELKAAGQGCPERIYDTLSRFARREDGFTFI